MPPCFPTGWRCLTAAAQIPFQTSTVQELMTPTMWASGERCCPGKRFPLSLKPGRNFVTGTPLIHLWFTSVAASFQYWIVFYPSLHYVACNNCWYLPCSSSADTLMSWSCTSCSSECADGSRLSRCLWTKWAFSSDMQPRTKTAPPTQ